MVCAVEVEVPGEIAEEEVVGFLNLEFMDASI